MILYVKYYYNNVYLGRSLIQPGCQPDTPGPWPIGTIIIPDFGYFGPTLANDAADQVVGHGHLVRLLTTAGSVVDVCSGTVGPQLAAGQRRQCFTERIITNILLNIFKIYRNYEHLKITCRIERIRGSSKAAESECRETGQRISGEFA